MGTCGSILEPSEAGLPQFWLPLVAWYPRFMKKLIIGCGYLGQRVANAWLTKQDEVWALTRSPERAETWLKAGIRPVLGDVNDPNVLADFREPQIDTLVYAVGWDRSSGKSQREVYVAGLENVLRAIGSRVRRLIYISSTSVYGQDDGSVVDEDSPCEPLAENGQVCLEAERVLRRACPQANILRLAGIYGPGRLVARVEALRAGTPLTGNPEAWLNMIHVDDAVQAVQACEQRGPLEATYLVADDEPLPRSAFYAAVCRRVGAPAPTFAPDSTSPRGNKTMNKRCSNSRLHTELRVELLYPTIEQGLDAVLPRT